MPIRDKDVETLRGFGRVTRDNKVVTERAPYMLTRKLEMHTGPGITEAVEGMGKITGSIEIPKKLARDLVGEALTLTLKDGRRLNFVIMNHDGAIQVTGSLEPPADSVQP